MKSFLIIFHFLFILLSNAQLRIDTASTLAQSQEDNQSKPFIIKGWLKFFTYTPSFYSSSIPNKFDFNPAYKAQFTWGKGPSFSDKDKDEFGWFNIIDDTHFFFILTKTTLYAVYARRNDISKTYKSLEIKWIEPITYGANNRLTGGLEDLGNYREGFCFKVKSKTNVIWNICADTMDQKTKWMDSFSKLIEQTPVTSKSSGASLLLSQEIKIPFQISQGSLPLPETGLPQLTAKPGSKIDGKWVILQDWSQCTQICGGGRQYLQRLCVPPQNGGIPCDGETLLVKECNTNPCPTVITTEKQAPANPTVIKMQPLSSRPLRYEICVVREIDLDLGIEGQGFAVLPKYPVRVILNNKTLSIFSTPSYDNVYKSFDLNYLTVKSSPQESVLCNVYSDTRDQSKQATLCVMATALKENESIEKYKENWVHDIFFFRDKCKDKNKFVDDSPEIKQKRMQLEIESQQDKFLRIQEKENEDQQKVIEVKVQEKAKLALQAVEKEAKFEQLALEEELMREKQEENMLSRMVENEQERKKCMEREIRKRQKLSDVTRQNMELAERARDLERQAALQVQESRKKFRDKIAKMKRASDRKRRETRNKIEAIRTTMAEDVMIDNYVGNIKNCNPLLEPIDRAMYCDKNFKQDPDKNRDCHQSEGDFCYVCCENEFGKNKEELRDRCYKLCDDVENGIDPKGIGFLNMQEIIKTNV